MPKRQESLYKVRRGSAVVTSMRDSSGINRDNVPVARLNDTLPHRLEILLAFLIQGVRKPEKDSLFWDIPQRILRYFISAGPGAWRNSFEPHTVTIELDEELWTLTAHTLDLEPTL